MEEPNVSRATHNKTMGFTSLHLPTHVKDPHQNMDVLKDNLALVSISCNERWLAFAKPCKKKKKRGEFWSHIIAINSNPLKLS